MPKMAAPTDSLSRVSRCLMLIPFPHTLQQQRNIARKHASSTARALHLLSIYLQGRAKSGIVGALAVVLGIFSLLMWRRHRLRSMERLADSSDSFLRMFSYMELKIATSIFRSKLGSGGFGTVFKGHLIDGTLVAVKKMEGSRQDEKQFQAEISSLGNIQHANLIRLRGFYAEGSRRFLIYDYMANGSLNSLLFTSNSKNKRKVLDWHTRFQIALGTARALVYLHEECRDRICHGDVKPGNILLDNNFSPKVADFGLAKLVGRDFSHVLTTTRGTRGYLAPEWISGLPITQDEKLKFIPNLSEAKLRFIGELKGEGMNAIVGIGVNDAQILATTDVGIGMGVEGSAIAMESA
ncbi:G-type lectin S-receptor-like serine/threonine-protein kinase At2g19130 [Cryptomeria japonica]|uniref:G-type lectin S-receptor-like serine/threonine-protein kinase At2g19130 n=1 Tax=Cryptomeria japonica TaxID=3369 RepID=UPI0025AC4391|nr:G-type lectin S-receptor-like serine/threonine-protein kinase At2g19130 [Cryptomeria japonica]